MCRSFCFNKVARLQAGTFFRKGFRHKCFPLNFLKILRRPILQNTIELLLRVFEGVLIIYINLLYILYIYTSCTVYNGESTCKNDIIILDQFRPWLFSMDIILNVIYNKILCYLTSFGLCTSDFQSICRKKKVK